MSTVQDVLQQFHPQFTESYSLSPQQAKVYRDILRCRTAQLGGHALVCEECGHTQIHYNSCRNRHCPTCQGLAKTIWVDKRSKDILHAPYFHVVFTLPKELHRLVYSNQELLYDLMYKSVAQTLLELSADNTYLGAQIGFFSLLHTWAQDLHYHPHIHTVVLAGGLTPKGQWRNSSKTFFIPVKVLAKKFRGKFLHLLKQYYRQKLLVFYGDAQPYQNSKRFQALLEQCYQKNWYSYTKPTFSGPLAVMKYLGRYTHRVAIANSRIVATNETTVTITVKSRKLTHQTKQLTLTGIEFVRRFLLHVLPKGFVKIRYYGLLANRNKKTKLELSRKLTGSPTYPAKFEGLTPVEILSLLTDKDITLCPVCGKGKLMPSYSLFLNSSP
jgi:hypothetical protein